MKLRLIMWITVITAMAIIIIQNRDYYLSEHTLSLNLIFTRVEIPPIFNVTQLLLFFLAGILLACASLYHERFKLHRQIKKLNTAFQSCAKQVTEMKPEDPIRTRKSVFKLPQKWRRKTPKTQPVTEIAENAGGTKGVKVMPT